MKAKERFNSRDWAKRHNEAVVGYQKSGVRMIAHYSQERFILGMIDSWTKYAEFHKLQFASQIGDDGALGPEWEAIGDSLRGLLNGDVGPRLDCGTLDSFIYDTMEKNAVEMDGK